MKALDAAEMNLEARDLQIVCQWLNLVEHVQL